MEEVQFKGVSPNYLLKILSLDVRGRRDQGCDDIISMYHADHFLQVQIRYHGFIMCTWLY